jgi:hypothetical protein
MVGGLKNEKRNSVWSIPEIDQKEERTRSYQSKIADSSQSTAPHQPGDRES